MAVHVGADHIEGRTEIRVKGDLQRLAEYLVVCASGWLAATAIALVCVISRVEGPVVLVMSISLGIANVITGVWYFRRALATTGTIATKPEDT